MGEFADSDSALVADVDCTAEGKPLCDSNGVQGFPTIKWGDPNDLQDYQGGREYDDLKKFADENLKPQCSPANLDLCDEEKKAEINTLLEKSEDELNELIAEGEKKIKDAEKFFEDELAKLQATYEKISKDKDAAVAEVKASSHGLYKSVAAHLKKA